MLEGLYVSLQKHNWLRRTPAMAEGHIRFHCIKIQLQVDHAICKLQQPAWHKAS